ncbi:MAG: diphthine--ammonia ligase [Lachnospirales bacterium]
MKGKKFVASFSGGKDSTLSIYRAMEAGNTPVGLITTFNENAEASWFHNIPKTYLEKVAKSLNIPLYLINTMGDDYGVKFEEKLAEMKKLGAEVCVFGDIDIEDHYKWCSERCKNVGLDYYFPLWLEDRKSLVCDFIEKGFKAVITVLNHDKMNKSFIGKTLTNSLVEDIELSGVDVCGENGEYHTFVYDGPIFSEKIAMKFKEMESKDAYTRIKLID